MKQELLQNNPSKVYSSRASEVTSESSEHLIPEETCQDSGIDGSVKDAAVIIKTNERKMSCDYGDACEAEVYFGVQVIH